MLARITGMSCSSIFLLLAGSAVFAVSAAAQTWSIRSSGIDTNLRGVSAPGDGHEGTVWVSGSNGVVMVRSDLGKPWKRLRVEGGEDLDFRGVVAFDESKAYLMSSGEGAQSRIYKTTDGGMSWKLEYSDKRKEFFLDALQCLSETDCYALGDPLDGRFVILHTRDGERWERLPTAGMPQALPQEGAFAASNSCLQVDASRGLYFVTGGGTARMFHSADFGDTWSVRDLPLLRGRARGASSQPVMTSSAISRILGWSCLRCRSGSHRISSQPLFWLALVWHCLWGLLLKLRPCGSSGYLCDGRRL